MEAVLTVKVGSGPLHIIVRDFERLEELVVEWMKSWAHQPEELVSDEFLTLEVTEPQGENTMPQGIKILAKCVKPALGAGSGYLALLKGNEVIAKLVQANGNGFRGWDDFITLGLFAVACGIAAKMGADTWEMVKGNNNHNHPLS